MFEIRLRTKTSRQFNKNCFGAIDRWAFGHYTKLSAMICLSDNQTIPF